MRKGNLRKTISAVLSFLLVLSMCFITMPGEVKAAGAQITITPDKQELVRGDTLTVTVSFSGNTEVYGMDCGITYNASSLKLKNITEGSACSIGYSSSSELDANPAKMIIAATKLIPDGTIMILEFEVLADAPVGNTGIGSSITLSNENAEPSSCNVVNNASNVQVTVPVTGITLDRTTLDMEKGNTQQLTATITPPDTGSTVTWTTSDPAVATITDDGTVTAIGGGTATITASAGGQSAACTVNVNVPLTGIKIKDAADSVSRGNTLPLSAELEPVDATVNPKAVEWSSSDPTIASVDPATGLVTGLKEGTTKITVTTKTTPSFSAEKEITVTENHATDDFGKKIVFKKLPGTFYKGTAVNMRELLNLDDVAANDHITDTFKITWSSSDEKVASIDANGVATGLKEGKTTIKAMITAEDASGNQTASFEVETETEVVAVPLKSIVFNKEIKSMKAGTTETLVIVYNPENTTDLKEVEWSSSDTTVLTVDQNGKITALKAGTAKITATSKVDKLISCSCEITVTASGSDTKPNTKPNPDSKPGNSTNTRPGTNVNTKPGNNGADNTKPGNNGADNTKPGNNGADNTKPGNNRTDNVNGASGDSNANKAPRTGDSADIVLFGVLAMASAAGIAAFSQKKRTTKR